MLPDSENKPPSEVPIRVIFEVEESFLPVYRVLSGELLLFKVYPEAIKDLLAMGHQLPPHLKQTLETIKESWASSPDGQAHLQPKAFRRMSY